LFPAEPDSPGASDINATSYLKNLLEENTFDRDEREFILNGPNWLNELANSEHGKAFAQLTTTQQEQLLQRIARTSAGENWLSLLLLYIFEALLSSPIYGGNPDGIGWRWLEHNPGFPQPTINTSYKKLSQR
jgi:gluconate 2-dehydrogenase gamma chain